MTSRLYTDETPLPSIIEFAEGGNWLALNDRKARRELYPAQKMALRALYYGTEGNDMRFSESGYPFRWNDAMENYIAKNDNSPVREFSAVWGRRTGKTWVQSIIALYEAFRLYRKGDPFGYYQMPRGCPLTILVISCSMAQAGVMFNEIREMIANSPYFHELGEKGYISLTTRAVSFFDEKGEKIIQIICHTAQSDSIIGYNVFSLLLDEPASFKDGNFWKIYSSSIPSLNSYVSLQPNGERGQDGKVVMFTSPRPGFVYLQNTEKNPPPKTLVLRGATWEINPRYSEVTLRDAEKTMEESRFRVEYGAEWGDINDEKTEQVTLRLRVSTIEGLKKRARKESYEKDKDILYTDIIRDLLEREAQKAA